MNDPGKRAREWAQEVRRLRRDVTHRRRAGAPMATASEYVEAVNRLLEAVEAIARDGETQQPEAGYYDGTLDYNEACAAERKR